MNFENTATVTEDSCRRWDRAVTSFTIQYPPNYKAEYNKRNNYLILSNADSAGNVIQEIAMGRNENITGREEIEKWTLAMDTILQKVKGYRLDTIKYDNYGNNEFYILSGTLNFDSYGQPTFTGDYKMTSFLVSPIGTNRENGVSWSVITKEKWDNEELRKEAEDILNTLAFKE